MPRPRTEPVLEHFAANLRRHRERAGLTQEQFAVRLQVDLRYLQRLERGKINVGLETLALCAAVLDIRPGELLRRAKLAPARRGRPARKTGRHEQG